MNSKMKLCLYAVALVVSTLLLVVHFFPMVLFRSIPLNNGHIVYKYYTVDGTGDITDIHYRKVGLSARDTQSLAKELAISKWDASISNDWNNHKIVFTSALGISFVVHVQSVGSERMQLNGVGTWLNAEASGRVWDILDKYITDDYVASGP